MSDYQQRGRKPAPKKENTTVIETAVTPVVVETAVVEEKPKAAEPKVTVDGDEVLRWAARLKTGGYGAWMTGANFANHMVKTAFRVNGKEISVEQASGLINPHTSVKPS